MAGDLQGELSALFCSSVSQSSIADPRAAHEIVGSIARICLSDVTEADADLAFSLIFNQTTGLVKFLREVILSDEYEDSKGEILQMLKTFVEKFPGKVHPYSVDVKDICAQLLTRDRRARVKNHSVPLLIEVLTQSAGSTMVEDFHVANLAEKCFMEMIKTPKPPTTVKANLLHLLGVLCDLFPEKMSNASEKLLNLLLRTLKDEMQTKSRKPEFALIAGCLLGLTHFMVNFAPDQGSKHLSEIYHFCIQTVDPSVKVTRYEMPRAGLNLLAKHTGHMGQFLIRDFKGVYEKLLYWTSHNNREMAHHGMLALEEFLKQVAAALVSQARVTGRKEGGAVFKFFIQRFRAIMDNEGSGSKEIALAVKGYGLFAAPCKMFLSPDDVTFMFNEMLQRSEQQFLSDMEQNDDKLISLHSFLGALASIVEELDQISETFLLSLERLVVLQMEVMPRLHVKLHSICFLSLIRLFLGLTQKGNVFRGFLERVVYQALIRSCSHALVLETQESSGSGPRVDSEEEIYSKQRISYKDYLHMWRTLLDFSKMKALAQLKIDPKLSEVLKTAIYDELLASILKMLSRLDLSSSAQDAIKDGSQASTSAEPDFVPSSDPIHGVHASRPQDFILFINLVELVQNLLSNVQVEHFHCWVFPFGHQLILQSSKLPLVSGFYKLLAVCMKICTRIGFFRGIGREGASPRKIEFSEEDQPMEDASGDFAQKEASFMLFAKFSKEVMIRMKQYKDDLLASCLTFIMALPKEIVVAEVVTFAPALQRCLEIGRSYLPLAKIGLDTLEFWAKSLPPDLVKPFYSQILPCLDAYLSTPSEDQDVSATISLTSKNPLKKQGKKKIPVKLLKQTAHDAEKGAASELRSVQERCVLLLGSLGGSVNNVLLEETSKDLVAWDSVQHLKFDIPFMDIKPTIYFDAFLPRVVELATTSTDRQTKVAASELLHALLLHMLGRSVMAAATPHDPAFQMAALYKKIFPALLKLATDVELVCKQLFEPLTLQLIHWFTGSKKFESPDTMMLLESLLKGVVSPTDSAVRDFSARCIKEFLAWSIKQTSEKQMKNNPANPKSLLKRLYSLLEHPSSIRRLGGALTFNSIYSVFREEESLVDQFSMEILVVLVHSLALAHEDEKSMGTQEQCKVALSHLERILTKKAAVFNKSSKQRRKPRQWTDATMGTAVRWLLRQCGRPQAECRHVCMQMVCKLGCCIEGVKDSRTLFEILLSQHGTEYLIGRFECGMFAPGSKMGLNQRSTMMQLSDHFSLKVALSWFDLVLVTLDCYTWVFGERLLSPDTIFVVSGNKGTVIFQVLNHFFAQLAMEDISAACQLFSEEDLADHGQNVFTPRERNEYDRAKCTVIVRTMNFLCALLGNWKTESLKVIPSSLWSKSLWRTILACVLQPTKLGFNMGDVEVLDNLPQQTLSTLQVLLRTLPTSVSENLIECMSDVLAPNGECDLSGKLPISLMDCPSDVLCLQLLVSGWDQLASLNLLSKAYSSSSDLQKLADNLVNNVFMGMVTNIDGRPTLVTLPLTTQTLADKMLSLAFHLGYQPKRLVDLLFNTNRIYSCSSNQTSPHGALFYGTFKSTINTPLVSSAPTFVGILMGHLEDDWKTLSRVLIGMGEALVGDRVLRKRHGSALTDAILNEWAQLTCFWKGGMGTEESKMAAITLLTKLILIDSSVLSHKFASAHVFQMYTSLLVDKATSLPFKGHALDLLPFFSSLTGDQADELKSCLHQFVADSFPMQSTEYSPGSQQHKSYISALDKILVAMELSGSSMLLELVISIMCKEAKHCHEDAIQVALHRFTKRLPKDKHKLALDVPYGIFSREGQFTNDQRLAALDRVCLTMLRLVHTSALIEFFCDHIQDIMKTIEAKQIKGSESALETQLITKIGCFELLEVMYLRLKTSEVNSKDSIINQCYLKPKPVGNGKEMNMAITKASHATKGEDTRGEKILLETRRQLHCAAYNTLIAVMTCTQTELKFFNAFLFTENLAKGQLLWDNIIDVDAKYEFPIEMENPMERRKRFVSIRSSVREWESHGDSDLPPAPSIHYLASQYLAGSSLSADVSQFDFGSSALSSASSQSSVSLDRPTTASKPDKSSVDSSEVVMREDYVEMEMDALNRHPCMAALSAVLQHMRLNEITPPVQTPPSAMPDWMRNLNEKLHCSTSPMNIRLFLAKLILNAEAVFRPYAKFWLQPLVALATSIGGCNYLTMDIVVTLLLWHEVATPEDTSVDVVEFMVEHSYHENRQIMRNNLEVLKTLVEAWRPRIKVPSKKIFKHFTYREDKGKRNVVGLQIAGVFLANGLSPWNPEQDVEKDSFFKYLALNMSLPGKAVYAASAEVVGMALHHMNSVEKGQEKWCATYEENIQKLLQGFQNSKPDQFLDCVHGMQRHYPPVVYGYLTRVLFMLPHIHGTFRTQALEIILSGIERIDQAFLQLKNSQFLSILKERDETVQLVCLKIIRRLLTKLDSSELCSLLPSLTAMSGSSSPLCRLENYQILMWAYDTYRDEAQSNARDEIVTRAKQVLLQGLSDEDLSNRLTVQNFWSHETRLPGETIERLAAMLEAMYSPETERHYLSYATNLLLQMTSKSPDFNRLIHEQPLSECRFQDYSVSSSWFQRHAAMTPLFVETQSSQPVESLSATDDMDRGQLRATQDAVQFTPTQAEDSKGPYNWLTQSSLDTLAEGQTLTLSSQSESSLLFTVGKSRLKGSGKKDSEVKDPMRSGPKAPGDLGASEASKEILRLKKRFIHDQQSTAQFFMKRNIRLKKLREDIQREQKMKREHHVTVYRHYRSGDFPDIQIKYSCIIAPLQALALRDSSIARLLFGSVFRAIFSQIESEKTERETQELTMQISSSLGTMLESSIHYFPPFMSCILEIAQHFPRQLMLDPAAVSTACTASSMQPLGILMLEESLLESMSEAGPQPLDKRARTSRNQAATVNPVDSAKWVELAKLYKSIGDYDVLRGIFSNQCGTKKLTAQAMEAEMRGSLKEALQLYQEGLSRKWEDEGEAEPSEAEADMWDAACIECAEQLTQWKDVEKLSTAALDDLSSVWDSTYYQEVYLRPMVSSKLKLLLEGDDSQQPLLTFIDESMKIPERKALLERSFCEELALVYIHQMKYDRARHYANMAVQVFIQDWSNLGTKMLSPRAAKLQSLQELTELHEFLRAVSINTAEDLEQRSDHLVRMWVSRQPNKLLDPVTTWDNIMLNRCVYMEHLSEKLSSVSEVKMEADAGSRYDKQEVMLRLAQTDSARVQNNFPVALKHMKTTMRTIKQMKLDELSVPWCHGYARVHLQRCAVETSAPGDRLQSLTSVCSQLEKKLDTMTLRLSHDLQRDHHMLKGETLSTIAAILQNEIDLNSLDEGVRNKVKEVSGCHGNRHNEVVKQILEESYQCFKCSVGIGITQEDSGRSSEGINAAYMALAIFCDKYLRDRVEDDDLPQCGSGDDFPMALVTSLLGAMKNGSKEAKQLFPRLLQIVEKFPSTQAAFIKKCKEIPCWMFLGWISQITAILDKPESAAIHDLLLSVAKMYPDALVYPFKMSCTSYSFSSDPIGRQSEAIKTRIQQILSKNKLIDLFIAALEQFTDPYLILKDWISDLEAQYRFCKSKVTSDHLLECYKELCQQLMVKDCGDGSLYDASPDTVMGSYRTDVAKKYAPQFDAKLGKNGSKIHSMDVKSALSHLGAIRNIMEKDRKNPSRLKDYSPWLAEFQASDHDMSLEIPGQYTGNSCPMPEYHTKISSFDEKVQTQKSLRRPRRITLRGNDEQEYSFLVKGGEDLRQDQRILQVFQLMNEIYSADPACRARRLKLRTYQVIPMTPRVGVIEWMNNVTTLKLFLEHAAEIAYPKNRMAAPVSEHFKWLGGDNVSLYPDCYMKFSRSDAVTSFRRIENMVPWDLCRVAYKQLQSSPEAYFLLRCNFATSHALNCISQYILGIGDRHLSNHMIDQSNGKMVAIDFGHAFGSATQFLPVPELMPFRLTRQLRNLMLPLQEKGLIEGTMIHALRALRSNKEMLISMLDIFIKEPSLDWEQFARKQMIAMVGRKEDVEELKSDAKWFPNEKIGVVRKKLNGHNPCHIMRLELLSGHKGKPYTKHMERVLLGDKDYDIRARLPESGLTAEEQVACLLNHATDPNILARTYCGWEAWV